MEMEKYVWVMPEERDEKFSEELFNRFKALADSLKVSDFLIEIKEKYSNEDEPHYHLMVGSRACPDLLKEICCLSTLYLATAGGKTYKGKIMIKVQSKAPFTFNMILASALFGFYDEYVREFYPEWQTDYKTIGFSS